jgi:hypothetical protein
MEFTFVKASELKVGDIVHRTTGLHRVHEIETREDGFLIVWLDWLRYPSGDDGGYEIEQCPPHYEFLRQNLHEEVPAPVGS